MFEYIKSDLTRKYGSCSFKVFVKAMLTNRISRYLLILRMCQGNHFWRFAGNIMWFFNQTRKTIQIPRRTKIGYGLHIGHFGSIVINPDAVIGNNCNISQGLTIGSNHDNPAVIGNNVYIGPNVCIVENVKIGNNVTIGAGSVVTKDIPDDATAAGNYAKVLNFNNPARYINNVWKIEKEN